MVLAISGCSFPELEYADDVVIFAKSSKKLQHVVNLVSKSTEAIPIEPGCSLRNRVCHNEDLYAETDVVFRQITLGRYEHLAPQSKVSTEDRLGFFETEKTRMTISAYNARPLASDAAVEDLIMQARRFKYDVIGLTEMRRHHPLNAVYVTGEELFFGACDSRGVG
ncbi:hypothetical protein RB195_021890 [Necator americanus]|uniref:Reverse transcriptase domain-containing protein n=1 Tax=Necator americanus TaxID=51031 RepID=A0ABR1ED46_NECAM